MLVRNASCSLFTEQVAGFLNLKPQRAHHTARWQLECVKVRLTMISLELLKRKKSLTEVHPLILMARIFLDGEKEECSG